MTKRSIYKVPDGDPVDNAVQQYGIMDDAFNDHMKQIHILQQLIDNLSDEDFSKYLERTQK